MMKSCRTSLGTALKTVELYQEHLIFQKIHHLLLTVIAHMKECTSYKINQGIEIMDTIHPGTIDRTIYD